jgi:RNA polymerase sigma-70 factor (ECF subfamily)
VKKGTNLSDRTRRFEAATLPHLNAAYNLARWMLRDNHNAQDVVQEAYLRGLTFFDSFRGGDARPWLLGIVRNTCYTWLKENGRAGEQIEFDEERDSGAGNPTLHRTEDNPEELLIQKLERARIDAAIEELPLIFREVIILRELEELSYEEIAQVVAVPLGTIMSRLARARTMLRTVLNRAG